MDVTPLIREGQQVIQSYAGGRFRVNGEVFTQPIIVLPEKVELWSVKAGFEGLQSGDFEPLVALASDLDVILLGCGAKMGFLPPILKNTLKNQSISIDTMDTGAACRTYNVLMAEGRRVATALLLT